jgi:RimJ/RimL family protein N-acetyltransferase
MLRAKFVYLAPILDEDCPTLFGWINDRESVLHNAPFRPVHYANHMDWFNDVRRRPDVVIFAIRRVQDEVLLGSCQLHSISLVHRSAELQIRIGEKEERGKGYGTEAVRLLLAHAHRDLNLHRVQLHVLADNTPALHVYKNLGFRTEGLLRDAAFVDGRRVDVVIMSILSHEHLAE